MDRQDKVMFIIDGLFFAALFGFLIWAVTSFLNFPTNLSPGG